MKKLLAMLMVICMVLCMVGMAMATELPTVTFTHGYFHDESEWPVAAEMRAIYQEFADLHKDEFNFVVVADEGGAEGIYNTALNDLSAGNFYDIADFGGWDITKVGAGADAILDLKSYLDADPDFKAGAGVCYNQNLVDGKIYSIREQIEAVGFWYNKTLFDKAGAKTPDQWSTWADFDAAVDTLVAAKILPFALNAGWPTNILLAGYMQRNADSIAFYQGGQSLKSVNDPSFVNGLTFIKDSALGKIDSTFFGPGGDDDSQYMNEFTAGNSAMTFNGVWIAGDAAAANEAGQDIRPAVFPTDEAGKTAALLSGGTGFVVSNKLSPEQTDICIQFMKYMTSKDIATRIVATGISFAPSTAIDYSALAMSADSAASKLLIEACQLCSGATIQALGLGNQLGDLEGEIQSKYAGLLDGSVTVEAAVAAIDGFIAAE